MQFFNHNALLLLSWNTRDAGNFVRAFLSNCQENGGALLLRRVTVWPQRLSRPQPPPCSDLVAEGGEQRRPPAVPGAGRRLPSSYTQRRDEKEDIQAPLGVWRRPQVTSAWGPHGLQGCSGARRPAEGSPGGGLGAAPSRSASCPPRGSRFQVPSQCNNQEPMGPSPDRTPFRPHPLF